MTTDEQEEDYESVSLTPDLSPFSIRVPCNTPTFLTSKSSDTSFNHRNSYSSQERKKWMTLNIITPKNQSNTTKIK